MERGDWIAQLVFGSLGRVCLLHAAGDESGAGKL